MGKKNKSHSAGPAAETDANAPVAPVTAVEPAVDREADTAQKGGLVCIACGERAAVSEFSSAQKKKNSKRKCAGCVKRMIAMTVVAKASQGLGPYSLIPMEDTGGGLFEIKGSGGPIAWSTAKGEPPHPPLSYFLDESQQTAETKQMMVQIFRSVLGGGVVPDSMDPAILLYPENPAVKTCLDRGTVGHSGMLQFFLRILADRADAAVRKADAMHPRVKLPFMRARDDVEAGLHQRALRQRFDELSARVDGAAARTAFLLVPLGAFFGSVSHMVLPGLMKKNGLPKDLTETIMKIAYTKVIARIHVKGPPPSDGTRPLTTDLVGPLPFIRGLKMQCAMTPVLAMFATEALYQQLQKLVSNPMHGDIFREDEDVFIFPHAMVLALPSPSVCRAAVETTQKVAAALGANADDALVEPVCFSKDPEAEFEGDKITSACRFLELLETDGVPLYPFFSDVREMPTS